MGNNPMAFDESVLGDVVDLVQSITSNKKKDANDDKKLKSSSIAKSVSNLTLTFPVICSRGIAINNAAMVTKALERNFVTMVQQLLLANNINEYDNVQDYINNFHSNIDSTVVSFEDLLNYAESSIDYITPADMAAINESMRKYNGLTLPSAINEHSLMGFSIREGAATENADKKEWDSKEVKTTDSDYKKANETTPSLLTINFKVKTGKDGRLDDYGNALIGIKAKLYPIASNDISSHVITKTTGNANWLVNFLKLVTREVSFTSFVKDFIFAVEKSRADAASYSTKHPSGADKMWHVLERRASKSRINRFKRDTNAAAAAITTLCVSKEEVDEIKKTSGIDLESVSTIRGLFESYNLICVCIVDEVLEVAKFIYDTNDPSWESYPFSYLERESNDNTYKRVLNLIGK